MKEYFKNCINVGTLGGLVFFAYFVLLYSLKINPLSSPKVFMFWLPVVVIFYVQKKSSQLEIFENYTFRSAFSAGITSLFFYASSKSMLIYFYITFFARDFVGFYIDNVLSVMERTESIFAISQIANSEEFANNLKQLNNGSLALAEFNNTFLGGLLVILVGAFVFRRKKVQSQS